MFFLTPRKAAVVHGVFPSNYANPHLHGEFTLTELMLETARNRYAIHAGLNLLTRNFATLGPLVTGRRLLGLPKWAAPIALTFQHRAGVRFYISTYVLVEPCVLINSLFLVCTFPFGRPKKVFFIEVTKHFAEFLQHYSLKRPNILY